MRLVLLREPAGRLQRLMHCSSARGYAVRRRKGWESLVARPDVPALIDTSGSIGKEIYVCNGKAMYTTPSKQRKAKIRSIPSADLPGDLLEAVAKVERFSGANNGKGNCS